MIKVHHLPQSPMVLACSGGVDSMAVLHFLKASRKDVRVLHVDHKTPSAPLFRAHVEKYCRDHHIPCEVHVISGEMSKGQSKEEFWRQGRYDIFHTNPLPVLTVHHLDDAMETWVFSSLHGQGKIIPVTNKNVVRPFLLTRKHDLLAYATRHNVPFVEDPSNQDEAFMRNKIRHQILPLALEVNPGLAKVIRKKTKEQYESLTPQNQSFML